MGMVERAIVTEVSSASMCWNEIRAQRSDPPGAPVLTYRFDSSGWWRV
jgi:hypothetical protein